MLYTIVLQRVHLSSIQVNNLETLAEAHEAEVDDY